VIVQFGGQTPLNLALELKRNGVPSLARPGINRSCRRPPSLWPLARRTENSSTAQWDRPRAGRSGPGRGEIGLPVLVRPSYVLGGRAMVIAYDVNTVQEYVAQAALMAGSPVLIDQFLKKRPKWTWMPRRWNRCHHRRIMEHIEEAACTPAIRPACCLR